MRICIKSFSVSTELKESGFRALLQRRIVPFVSMRADSIGTSNWVKLYFQCNWSIIYGTRRDFWKMYEYFVSACQMSSSISANILHWLLFCSYKNLTSYLATQVQSRSVSYICNSTAKNPFNCPDSLKRIWSYPLLSSCLENYTNWISGSFSCHERAHWRSFTFT